MQQQHLRHRRLREQLEPRPTQPGRQQVFRDGFIVGIANPKTIVFFPAILPRYVNPNGAPAQLQMLALGLVFVAVALLSDGARALAARTARHWFACSPRRLNRLGTAGGAAMICLGLQLAEAQGLKPIRTTDTGSGGDRS